MELNQWTYTEVSRHQKPFLGQRISIDGEVKGALDFERGKVAVDERTAGNCLNEWSSTSGHAPKSVNTRYSSSRRRGDEGNRARAGDYGRRPEVGTVVGHHKIRSGFASISSEA